MSEGESRFTVMHKLIAGALIGLLILSAAGYFVYSKMSGGSKPAVKKIDLEKLEFEAKDNITLEEFSIFIVEGEKKGIVKFKVNAEVDSPKVAEFLNRSKPAVRDTITRTIMKMKFEDIKQKYSKLELHEIIKKDLNAIVDKGVKGSAPTPEGGIAQNNLVVRVNVFDFSALEID